MNKISQIIVIILVTTVLLGGAVYAVIYTYNKIWKEPEVYNFDEEIKVTEKDIESSLSDEEINIKVNEILEWLNINQASISEKHLFKNPENKQMSWVINLENNISLSIDSYNGNLIQFTDSSFNDLEIASTVTQTEAEAIANEIFDSLGYSKDDYELARIIKNGTDSDESLWKADFCKKYDNIYNYYQCIRISFVPEIKKIKILTIFDEEYYDNPIIITEEEAIQIAKEKAVTLSKDENEFKNISVSLEIQKMNTNIYSLENDINNALDENFNNNSDVYLYRTSETTIRKVWTVELAYTTEYNKISRYYVDVTTGEIIGGDYNL